MINILKSFLTLSFVHGFLSFITKSFNTSNIITCIFLQLYFLFNAFNNLRTLSILNTLSNLDMLSGYFLYDIIAILLKRRDYLFILHHIIGLKCIYNVHNINIDVIYSNIICIILEIVNPFINLRYIIPKKSYFYNINFMIIFIMYTFFRIIVFPYVSFEYLIYLCYNNKNTKSLKSLLVIFLSIYLMSLYWYNILISKIKL